MNQMPSSGTTSSGGGSPIRHVSGATGHSSTVVPSSATPSSPRSASLSFVSAATTTFSFAEKHERRDEAGHRAAVAGEDPVAVAAQPEAEPVARQPALVVGDRLHRPHLLGARRGEHGLVGIGEERAPAADVAGRPPQLARRRPGAGLHADRVPDAVGVRLREVALRCRRLRLEAHPRQADRLEQPLADVVLVRQARDALDDDAEQREREIGVVEPGAGRQHELGLRERLEQLVRRREAKASATSRPASRAAGPTRARAAAGSSACAPRPRRAGRACPRDRACPRRAAA